MPPNKDRIGTWASNGRLSIYLFLLVLFCWIAFNIWHSLGGPPPDGLTPLMTTTLTFAVAMNSIERRNKEEETQDRVTKVEEVVKEARPDLATDIQPGQAPLKPAKAGEGSA